MEESDGASDRHWRHLIPGGTLENSNHRGGNSPMGWGGAGLGVVPVERGGKVAIIQPGCALWLWWGRVAVAGGATAVGRGMRRPMTPRVSAFPLSPRQTPTEGGKQQRGGTGGAVAPAPSAPPWGGAASAGAASPPWRGMSQELHNPSAWIARRQRLATQPLQSGVTLPLSHTMGGTPSGNRDALPNPLSSKGAMAPAATGTGLKPPSPMTASTIYSLLRALTPLLPPLLRAGGGGAMASPLPVAQPQPVPSGYEAHETRFQEILKSDLALPARVWP